jgi:hypothetical protein
LLGAFLFGSFAFLGRTVIAIEYIDLGFAVVADPSCNCSAIDQHNDQILLAELPEAIKLRSCLAVVGGKLTGILGFHCWQVV